MRKNYLDEDYGGQTNNYAVTCEIWRKKYLEMDREELARRFRLESDQEAFYIVYFHERYRLDRETGMITLAEDPDRVLVFNTLMSIYNLFYYAKPDAKIRGEFVPFRLVKRASPFEDAYKRTILGPLAKTFSGHCDLLDKACIALGGIPIRQGDVGYVVNAFDWMPLTIVFWDGDDEFEAQTNILFDADITDFIHEENVCCVASDLVRRLAEEAGFGRVEHLL